MTEHEIAEVQAEIDELRAAGHTDILISEHPLDGWFGLVSADTRENTLAGLLNMTNGDRREAAHLAEQMYTAEEWENNRRAGQQRVRRYLEEYKAKHPDADDDY